MKKSSLVLCMIICFFIKEINFRGVEAAQCPNKFNQIPSQLGEEDKGYIGNLQYFFKNKNIKVSQNGDKFTMSFEPIDISKNKQIDIDEFRIIYTAKFYDKEQIGVDKIQSINVYEKYLYRYDIMKVGEETKDKVEWELKMKETEKEQIVQLIGEANYNKKSDYYVYDSFIIKYEQGKNESDSESESESKRELEFWIIFGGMVGIIPLIFILMFAYILIKGKEERPSIAVNTVSPTFTDRDTTGTNSNMTS